MRPQAVLADFQSLYASLLALERLPNGRYPERAVLDAYAMPLTEYTRRAIITGATARQLDVITTNSDGSPARRAELLGLLGAGATELVLDPGVSIVRDRLSVDGALSTQCEEAIGRWYNRLDILSL